MESNHYSSERNIQILIALLKANGIRKIVASPGTTNFSLLGSLQNDSFFEIYSSVDERSAAYIAVGLAAESGEPVMLSCTGATASRNYYPGLTEAFYRQLPVLAITSHQGADRIGQLRPQNIDRRNSPDDLVRYKVLIPVVNTEREAKYVELEINKALLELKRNGGGPVHINLDTIYSRDFSVEKLPDVRVLHRYESLESVPEIPSGKIGVYVGAHNTFTKEQIEAIDNFCATYDAVVFCDHTSGYYGKYRILPTLELMQTYGTYPIDTLDLMIHIGGVSAAVFAGKIKTKAIWRVNPDGEIRDPFDKLTDIFQMEEEAFFNHYTKKGCNQHGFVDECQKAFYEIYNNIPELPFSNIWCAQQLSGVVPDGSIFHISASHSRRAWNIFNFKNNVTTMCNVGCCGIDGCTSTLVGASLAKPSKLCFLVTGDLAFFYDLNVLGNRHIGNNIRILLINNGIGGEFKIHSHPCSTFGDRANEFMAAEGHFGHKSPELIKHFAQDLGFRYMTAGNKEDFIANMKDFVDKSIDKPIIFEVFTDACVEADVIDIICSIEKDVTGKTKTAIKSVIGEGGVKVLRSIFKK